jgi:hypothetical protein
MIIFLWLLNLGISLWNAYAVGKVWVEAKHAGGGYRFMAWMGYLMASITEGLKVQERTFIICELATEQSHKLSGLFYPRAIAGL